MGRCWQWQILLTATLLLAVSPSSQTSDKQNALDQTKAIIAQLYDGQYQVDWEKQGKDPTKSGMLARHVNLINAVMPRDSDVSFESPAGYTYRYGEVNPDSISTVIASATATSGSKGEFWDLGSGTGKVIIQEFLEGPWEKVIGVELLKGRFEIAVKAMQRLQDLAISDNNGLADFVTKKLQYRSNLAFASDLEAQNFTEGSKQYCIGPTTGRQLCVVNGDMFDVNLKKAGMIYMCNTCFGRSMMNDLVERQLSTLPENAQILTLESLPSQHLKGSGIQEIVKMKKITTDWEDQSVIHFYQKQRLSKT